MTFCYFSCLGRYCFRPTSMAALSLSALARWLPCMKVEFDMTLWGKVDLCNSSQVYCSRLCGNPNTKGTLQLQIATYFEGRLDSALNRGHPQLNIPTGKISWYLHTFLNLVILIQKTISIELFRQGSKKS
jgi:hypothetical protein